MSCIRSIHIVSFLKSFVAPILFTAVTVATLFAPCISNSQQSQTETEFHIVFDIDWTLVNPTNERMANADVTGIIRVENGLYRLSKSAIDVLITLHQIPDIKISFFSGGSAERNKQLLQQVYEILDKKVGHKAYRPYKILNINHMVKVSDDTNLKFHLRYKKDLSVYFDLNQTLLIDDVKDFTPKGQERNLLWTGKTYNDRIRYELGALEAASEQAYTAPNQQEWQREQMKLIRLLGIVLESRSKTLTDKISIVDAAQEVLTLEAKNQFNPIKRASKEKVFDPLSCSAKFQ